jgi:hypothetical protein
VGHLRCVRSRSDAGALSNVSTRKWLEHRVPQSVPKWIWGALDRKTVSATFPKAHFCPARPDTMSGAPSPSPSHRGRTGDAGHNEMRGEEARGRRVSGTVNFNLTVAYLATEVIRAQRHLCLNGDGGAGETSRRCCAASTRRRRSHATARSRAIFPPLLACSRAFFPTPASIKGLPAQR